MSRAVDYYNKLRYGYDVLTGSISPLRFANDAIIKPLVFALSSKLGANKGELAVADDIFESIYSLASLDPYSSLQNIYKAYDDYQYYTGKTKSKTTQSLIKT
jgi:hypothetical protein